MEIETLEPEALKFLPYLPQEDIDQIVEDTDPGTALIPPYDLKSEHITAAMTDSIRVWYPERTIGIVMPLVIPVRLCQLVRTFSFAGFSPIVFLPEHRIKHHIPRLKQHLKDQQWYHVCDPKFEIPFEGVKGRWTKDGV